MQCEPDMTQSMAPMNIDETIQEDPQEDEVDAMPLQDRNDDTMLMPMG